jgi:hypothetical protein
MMHIAKLFTAASLLALAACSGAEETVTTNEADEYAARIAAGAGTGTATGTGTGAPEATQTPTIAPSLEGAAPGAYAPGTATDPASAICGANLMGPYIGALADVETRNAIMIAATGASSVRFVTAGSDYINPDPTNPRLNLMLDGQGIIRDARCG